MKIILRIFIKILKILKIIILFYFYFFKKKLLLLKLNEKVYIN